MKSKLNFKSNKIFLILVILILFTIFLFLIVINNKIKSINQISNISSNINNEETKYSLNNLSNSKETDNNIISYLSIPSISLEKAPIKEGIDEVTLNEYIGHFPSTSKIDGNIGLAAHNRGYKNNYFMNINKLQNGDEIIYRVDDISKKYKVEKKIEIDSYDWSYLNQTADNRITLITCIDNSPTKRLVVQAVE